MTIERQPEGFAWEVETVDGQTVRTLRVGDRVFRVTLFTWKGQEPPRQRWELQELLPDGHRVIAMNIDEWAKGYLDDIVRRALQRKPT